MDLPFSQACENNKQPILEVISRVFQASRQVLEIGSGTGQHAVYFAQQMNELRWQPTEQAENIAYLTPRLTQASLANVLTPVALSIGKDAFPSGFDSVFSANTAHIMPWEITQRMLQEVGANLPSQGVFALYGPFNYAGEYTSESNRAFDLHLAAVAPHQGIRDFEAVTEVAKKAGLNLLEDNAMPANNRLLVWRKE